MSEAPRDPSNEPREPDLSDLALNDVGVLRRRAIEARILAPVIDALGAELGHERVRAVVREVVTRIAKEQGAALAAAAGGCSLAHFERSLANWTKDDALQLRVIESPDETLAFDVVRCRYAEMYRALGVPELGALLSCSRDGALTDGFNPAVELTRTQTLMQGAPLCDFRYRLRRRAGGETQAGG